MSDSITKKDIEIIVSKSSNEILEVMQTFIYQIDERFKLIDKRFDLVDKRFDDLTNIIECYAGKL